MPALNFQPRFADLVATGNKCQSLRPRRKNEIKPGQRLHFFTGQRTKNACRRIGEAVCLQVVPAMIAPAWVSNDTYAPLHLYLAKDPLLHGEVLTLQSYEEAQVFAQKDGFNSWQEFCLWFLENHGDKQVPFYGNVIHWGALLPPKARGPSDD